MSNTQQKEDQIRRLWRLYVLKLEHDKYYVGITTKAPEERMREHVAKKRGAYWTMKYKPLEIVETEELGTITKSEAEYIENGKTRSLMKKYGLNNVRGGDLRDISEYIVRFGWVYDKQGWDIAAYIVLINLILIALVLDKYEWNIGAFISIILVAALVMILWKKFGKHD